MPRTRGQEVALQERGLPTTPPQQLPTPRRSQKAKGGTNKTKRPVATTLESSSAVQTNSRSTRTRKTSAPQSEKQEVLKPVRTAVKKRTGQANTKSKKGSQSADEEVIGEEKLQPKILQELPENSSSQAVQLAPRENPHISSAAPVSYPLSPIFNKPYSSSSTTQPSKKVPPIAKVEVGRSTRSSKNDGITQIEPELFAADSILHPSENIQEQKLMEIMQKSIPKFIALLRKHPDVRGNTALERLLTERHLSVTMKPLGKSRTRQTPPTQRQSLLLPENVSQSPRFVAQPLKQPLLKRKIDQSAPFDMEGPSKRPRINSGPTKRVPQLFDENGMLSLEAYTEVPLQEGTSSDEQASDTNLRETSSRMQQQTDPNPVTPQSRGWALSGFLPSAQTVSKFLPSFSRRTPAAAPDPVMRPSTVTGVVQTEASPMRAGDNDRSPISNPSPLASDGTTNERHSSKGRTARRHHQPKTKRALKARMEKEEISKRDEMIASLRAQLEAQTKSQPVRKEVHTKSMTLAENLVQAETMLEKATPKQSGLIDQAHFNSQAVVDDVAKMPKSILKRKTISPSVIPNPPGGGFGLVLDYFGQDSDSDDEHTGIAGETGSPTGTPSKKVRLSGESTTPLYIGDRFRATPYIGKELALPAFHSEKMSTHEKVLDTDLDAEHHSPISTPSNGPTVTIKVPSPGDSDSEWDGTSYLDALEDDVSATPSVPAPALNRSDESIHFSGLEATENDATATNAWSQGLSPFDNPNVNPAFDFSGSLSKPKTLREQMFPSTWNYKTYVYQAPSYIGSPNVALDKARQSALKHQPQQPSRLRETARLSTSTAGTDIGDPGERDENKVVESNEFISKTKKNHQIVKVDKASYGSSSEIDASGGNERHRNEQVNKTVHESPLPKASIRTDAGYFEDPQSRDPYAGQLMRRSPHNTMIIEPVPPAHEPLPAIDQSPELTGDISTDTITSEEDTAENVPAFDSYAKIQNNLVPRLQEQIRHDWGNDQNNMQTETGLANFDELFEEFFKSRSGQSEGVLIPIPTSIHNQVGTKWTDTDDKGAMKAFGSEFNDYLHQPT